MLERGWTLLVVLVVGLAGLVMSGLAVPAVAVTTDDVPRPVLNVDFPDPAVVAARGGLVGYSTGDRVPHAWSPRERGPWRRGGAVLSKRPDWATEGGIWAVDVARVRGRWLLYYAVPVAGLGEHGRCVAVARGRSARGPFRPVGSGPLVCPDYAQTPPAQDPLLPRDQTLPRAGVIDPSVYVEGGQTYLLYKTDRIPSSIRVLPLNRWGVRAAGESREILRSDDVIENPVLTKRDGAYVLFTSEGDWTRCSYRTTWRRSADLLDWTAAIGGVLLDRHTTPLCGPGGADLVTLPGQGQGQGQDQGRVRMYLHGWTCHGSVQPCRGRAKWDHRKRARGVRAMYAAEIRWPEGVPVVSRWNKPH